MGHHLSLAVQTQAGLVVLIFLHPDGGRRAFVIDSSLLRY